MKTFIVLFTTLISNFIYAETCTNKISPKKFIIFIDANNGEPEIEVAKKAACKRGENLIVVPKNYSEFTNLTNKAKLKAKEYSDCVKKKNKDVCAPIAAELQTMQKTYIDLFTTQKPIAQQLKSVLGELKEKQGKVSSLIISGHDGGGMYGGAKLSTNKESLANVIKDFPTENQITSLILLGCYSAVPKEIIDWNEILPKVNMIAGYDASAPLSDRPSGLNFLYDLLIKEPRLTSLADQKKLEKIIRIDLRKIEDVNAAIFIKPVCSNNSPPNNYYFQKNQLRIFDPKECEKVEPELISLKSNLDKYYNGTIEPPLDTVNGELRKIYNKARQYEHCINKKTNTTILDPNITFGLLFYHAEKENFTNFYNNEMKKVENIVSKNTPEILKEIWIPTKENLKNKTRKDIFLNMHLMNKHLSARELNTETRTALYWANQKLSERLQFFNNPFSWHEFTGITERPFGNTLEEALKFPISPTVQVENVPEI